MGAKIYKFMIYDPNKAKYNLFKGKINSEKFEGLMLNLFPNFLFGETKKFGISNSNGEKPTRRLYALYEGNNIITKICAVYGEKQTEVSFMGRNIEEVVETLKQNSDFKWESLTSNEN